jgi:hypothetical protein
VSDIEEAEQEEADRFMEELETLLRSFEENEVKADQFAQFSVQDPVLLLFAQHRGFRISRWEIFCPVENCHPKKPLRTLGKLTNHMQTVHGTSKEETVDMVRYFISRLMPFEIEIEMKVTARDGHPVTRKWKGIFQSMSLSGMRLYQWKWIQC